MMTTINRIKHRSTGQVIAEGEGSILELIEANRDKLAKLNQWGDCIGANLKGADLHGADPQGADLTGALSLQG